MSTKVIRAFGGLSASLTMIYVFAIVVVRQAILESERPEVLAYGLCVDLGFFVPFLYYLFMVRGLGWPRVSLIPVFLFNLVVAACIVPTPYHDFFVMMQFVAVPLEVGLVLYILYRARKAVRKGQSIAAEHEVDTIETISTQLIGHPRISRLVAYEISVLYFGIFSWVRGLKAVDAPSFTAHRRCGYGSIFAVIILVMVVEVFAFHLLLTMWSPIAAWIVTGLSLYGSLWLVADYRAVLHAPIRLTDANLFVRFGLRWRLEIPYSQIREPRTGRPEGSELNLSLWGEPSLSLHLKAPIVARGPYGIEKEVSVLGLALDEPEEFCKRLRARID